MMKTFADNQLIQKIVNSEENQNALVKACLQAGLLTDGEPLQITLGWPSLLEYLGQTSLLENFPTFDEQNDLFALIRSLLPLEAKKEQLIRAYDQVFVECLTHVKALPQINPSFLLQHIHQKRQSAASTKKLFAQSLDRYEELLREHPTDLMHNLILYLAWDRACINLAIVFEHLSPSLNIQFGLEVLKECLLESFQHITAHGRTTPGFFRLLEALYAYQMREEKLQIHSDDEWAILCQSAAILKPRDILSDVWYIDAAVADEQKINVMKQKKEVLRVFALDSADKVQVCLSLANYMIAKLKKESAEWRYLLAPIEVICWKQEGSELVIDAVVRNHTA